MSMLAIIFTIFVMAIVNEQERIDRNSKYSYWVFKFWRENFSFLIIVFPFFYLKSDSTDSQISTPIKVIAIAFWLISISLFLVSFWLFYFHELSIMWVHGERAEKNHYLIYFKDFIRLSFLLLSLFFIY